MCCVDRLKSHPETSRSLIQCREAAVEPKRTFADSISNTIHQARNMSDAQLNISLTRSEALVLFELVARYSESDCLEIEDQAEQRVL
jgi:hypothetical protein